MRFGTSGLRDTVTNMTDRECYINAKGFIAFLEERGEIKKGQSVALGGDLRSSTPRIMMAVLRAVEDKGYTVDFCGAVPTPVLAYFAIEKGIPSIMVTGSHIPEDRNGIKFTKTSGEVLKTDETDILKNVTLVRDSEHVLSEEETLFNENGMFKKTRALPAAKYAKKAAKGYIDRYLEVFPRNLFKGKKIALYEHSAVGRDIVRMVFKGLGAEVVSVGRSDKFIPVDTEKISDETRTFLQKAAAEHKPFAVISTDGDSDRPLLADENGRFLPGDKLGALVALYLRPDFAALPVSANDAVVSVMKKNGVEITQTKIGSPYVIAAMKDKLRENPSSKVVSWESNGGFLTGSDWTINGRILKALPTRDAVLPLISVLALAVREKKTVSELINAKLPARYTRADVVDNKTSGCENYTTEKGQDIVGVFLPRDKDIAQVDYENTGDIRAHYRNGQTRKIEDPKQICDLTGIKTSIARYFTDKESFRSVFSVNFIDGIKITFVGGDVVHLRPSGNAPEFRIYVTADTPERAEEIIEKRERIVSGMVRDLSKNPQPGSVGAKAARREAFDDTPAGRIIAAAGAGDPLYLIPHEESKVWGVNGTGEYWYGAESGEKSSIARVGEDTAPMCDIVADAPNDVLGEKSIERFGRMFPLVKILSPKDRLSVQFHDAKNELWIVMGINKSAAGKNPSIIVGFSSKAIERYGADTIKQYGTILVKYGDALNALIKLLEEQGHASLMDKEKNVIKAAEKAGKNSSISNAVKQLKTLRDDLEVFYNYRAVEIGEVIPIRAGTLHALGPGIMVLEPQIPGPTQSLEDGATYPVRYYFPGHKRRGAMKKLDLDRTGELTPDAAPGDISEMIEDKNGVVVERLPGNFEEKGLAVYRITMNAERAEYLPHPGVLHCIVALRGKVTAEVNGEKFSIPEARPGGEMLVIPAASVGLKITACGAAQIIDTFIPSD